jgi:hypothetical protein
MEDTISCTNISFTLNPLTCLGSCASAPGRVKEPKMELTLTGTLEAICPYAVGFTAVVFAFGE